MRAVIRNKAGGIGMGEDLSAEKTRKLKRSAWRNVVSQDYDDTRRRSIGKERERQICSEFAQGIILDVEWGTEGISTCFRSKWENMFAVDISIGMLTVQKDLVPCVCGDAEKLPFADETFDTVMATSLVVNFPNWDDILRELIRVLKLEGVLLFEISSREYLEYSKKYNPTVGEKYSTPETFQAFVSISELNQILNKEGTDLKRIIPYDYSNSNEILNGLIRENGTDKDAEDFGCLSGLPEFVPFWCWLEKNIFAYFPPGLSRKNFIIASKTNGERTVPDASCSKAPQSLNGDLDKALGVLKEKKEQLLGFYAECLNHGNGTFRLYQMLTELLLPVVELDVISLFHLIDKTTLTEKEVFLLESHCRNEFGSWTEKFVTRWHADTVRRVSSVCGVPCGPIIEYELMQELMKSIPETVYWDEQGK
jgi:ubiquinone/menaquinone biosynthesis C-methylase UbiE